MPPWRRYLRISVTSPTLRSASETHASVGAGIKKYTLPGRAVVGTLNLHVGI
jgi:hypothetical protein